MEASKSTKIYETLLIILSLCAMLAIVVVLWGQDSKIGEPLLVSLISIGGFSTLGLLCASIYDRYKIFSLFGIGASIFAFMVALIFAWDLTDYRQEFHVILPFTTLALAFAHSSIMLGIKAKTPLIRGLVNAHVAIIFTTGVLVVGAITSGESIVKAIAIAAILDIWATIIIPVLNSISVQKIQEEETFELKEENPSL